MATRTTASKKYGDAELRVHRDWLSLLQPVGLVVSPPALKKAGATPNVNVVAEQQRLIRLALPPPEPGQSDWVSTESAEHARIAHFPTFAVAVLGWRESDLVEKPSDLAVPVLDHDDVLQPSWGVKGDDGTWLLLVREEAPHGKDLDTVHEVQGQEWEATPQARFERLLRETKVHVGILTNGTHIRLVYAPAGESSGHVTFPVAAMCRVAGRPILAALLMLLGTARLWMKPEKELLPFILKESRKYQAEVTTKLADQVLDALQELLNGFQSAHVASGGLLVQETLTSKPGRQEIYGGLLASILRSVFVLYAEDRGLMPQHDTYRRGYSLTSLFEKLREDAAMYPDTMDQRYGAWTQLLALFRLIFDGAEHAPSQGAGLSMPAREGKLFNPDTYPFLEGRPYRSQRVVGDREKPPRVSDGVVYRVLEKLLILDGERLSYRALDVEQIGSVYEALMGFELEVALGASIAVKPKHVVVDLDAILRAKPGERDELLKNAEVKAVPKEVKGAKTLEELVIALDKIVSPRTPAVIPMGAMFLQPGEERRRSGSHYTPRALTEPIVATTLKPIIDQMGARPTPKDILALKVCDPAMGSGAFLVEACRQLADKLVVAWNQHPLEKPSFKGEEMVLRARREVAQRCLYGVDKNPFAVDLAKLSLWLATLAQDHPFTFLDHSLKCGDSLVGLTKDQIVDMAWPGMKQLSVARDKIEKRMEQALKDRESIFALGDSDDVHQKQRYLNDAEGALADVRLIGDAVIGAFFAGESDKQRDLHLDRARTRVQQWRDGSGAQDDVEDFVGDLLGNGRERDSGRFHWEIEFPEVFLRANSGFDAFVGNPPFAGKNTLLPSLHAGFLDWLKVLHTGAHGNSDLVAHFFRRAFALLREGGAFGLLATNTIAQGDTRATGLRPICLSTGTIYSAVRRFRWPGLAAVIVSVVHIIKGSYRGDRTLDGSRVDVITAFLVDKGGNEDPVRLSVNRDLAFKGSFVYGAGFQFDDTNPEASSTTTMRALISRNPQNQERIFPYLGGEELNASPTQTPSRYAINFAEMTEAEARRWPDLFAIVESHVKPERQKQNRASRAQYWWRFGESTPKLYRAVQGLSRVIACSQTSKYRVFAFVPSSIVYDQKLVVVADEKPQRFAVMQSRPHELWSLAFGSSMKDDPVYTPSDCFETFPFPRGWESSSALESIGQRYCDYRAALMIKNNEGLTKTYNRFHDPDERDPEILKLRALHDEMDRAVLDAYGWTDIKPTCTFLLDYEEDEDDEDEGGKRKKKKPWRYRWPDDVRDEVLARLMKLNAERYAEEQRMGADKQIVAAAGQAADAAGAKPAPKKKKAAAKKKKGVDVPDLFGTAAAEAGDE